MPDVTLVVREVTDTEEAERLERALKRLEFVERGERGSGERTRRRLLRRRGSGVGAPRRSCKRSWATASSFHPGPAGWRSSSWLYFTRGSVDGA